METKHKPGLSLELQLFGVAMLVISAFVLPGGVTFPILLVGFGLFWVCLVSGAMQRWAGVSPLINWKDTHQTWNDEFCEHFEKQEKSIDD